MTEELEAYCIYNITQKMYYDNPPVYGSGRKHLIYGDLRSARRMMNTLNAHNKIHKCNDKLRIVKLVPKLEKPGDDK